MKHFIKIFIAAFLCFALAVGAGVIAYMKIYDPQVDPNIPESKVIGDDIKESDNVKKDPLKRAIDDSKRVNVLLLGLEDTRTDTIIFASFDSKTKKMDLLSIPRDTYYSEAGHNNADQKKINAVYGRSNAKGTMNAVSKILGGIPIHYYVSVKYEGVEEIVNTLGGVEVTVPFHMKYDDTTVGKSLHIDIPKGKQVLDGENAVKFLRFRKSSNGNGYKDGDLGRIKSQQQFLKSAINKALSFKLPAVIKTCFNYVRTDMPLTDMLIYAKNAIGIDPDKDITMKVLPGSAKKGDYFRHDSEKIKEYILELYNVQE
ncbi:LCP family protein [Abyssisolibacter fermentans]|uniref:LCP family protein n=1 Tax=Abyssisolibacter fermentans TaxID=1766203 RepID=UPI00082AB26D|nr:LCP family protein [Abyssisolibacter fermentans]